MMGEPWNDENRLSVLSTNDLISMTEMSTNAEDIIQLLRAKVLALESENAGLKRSIPRLAKLLDSSGKDVTDQMTELTRNLVEKECALENANNVCAQKHEEVQRVRDELFRQLRMLEDKVKEATDRAKVFEEENRELREQMENEQSRIFRINNQLQNDQSGVTDAETLYTHSNEADIIEKLQRDLDDRLIEIEAYRAKINEWRQKFEIQHAEFVDLKKTNIKYHKFIDGMLSGNELRKSFLEKSLAGDVAADADYVVANMLALLELLDTNGRQINTLRHEIVEALRRNGYNANEANVAELSQSLCNDLHRRRVQLASSKLELNESLQAERFNDASSFNFNEIMKNTTSAGLLNRTMDMSQDIGSARRQMESLRKVCTQLFEKLRGTAEFLEQLLETLEQTDEGREILKVIKGLRLDLDKSINEANFAASEFEKAEKSMLEFCEMMSQLVDVDDDDNFSSGVNGLVNEQIEQIRREKEELTEQVGQLELQKAELTNRLENALEDTQAAKKQIEQIRHEKEKLVGQLGQLELQKAELTSQLEDAQTAAKEQIEQIRREKEELIEQLGQLESQKEELKSRLENAQAATKEQIEQIRREKEELVGQLEQLESQKAELKSRLENAQAATKEEIEQIQREKEELVEQLRQLELQKAELTSRLENAPTAAKNSGVGKKIKDELSDILNTMSIASSTVSNSGVFRRKKE